MTTSSAILPCQQFNDSPNLLPRSRKLLSKDAELVLSSVDNLIRKCILVTHVNELRTQYESVVGESHARELLDRIGELSSQYLNETNNKTSNLNSCGSTQHDDHPTELQTETRRSHEQNELSMELANHVRDLLRDLQDSDVATGFLKQLVHISPRSTASIPGLDLPISVTHFVQSAPQVTFTEDTNDGRGRLLEQLLRLRSFLFINLLSTPEDRKNKKRYKKDVLNRVNEFQIKIDQLERDLNQIIAKNDVEMERTAGRVNALGNEINNLNNYMVGKMEMINQDEVQKRERIEANSNGRKKELEQKMTNLTNAFKRSVENNRKEEKKLRSTIYKEETALEGSIAKYDQEMMALQSEYDTLDEEYTKEKKELNELEEKFLTLEEEYLEIMEERRIEEERRQREEAARLALEKAVTTIQAFWRSYKTRKASRGKRGGSKKGKK